MLAAEREYILGLLERSSSAAEAARLAGVSRQHFYRLCAKHGVAMQRGRANRGSWHLHGL